MNAKETYHTWITFIIDTTSLNFITTLQEYSPDPFKGNRFNGWTTDSGGCILRRLVPFGVG